MSPMRMLINLGILIAIAYAVLAATVFFVQPRLVYYPETGRNAGTPDGLGLDYEPVELATADGETLHGWFIPAPGATATVLFFHGNAGNISHRMGYFPMFY